MTVPIAITPPSALTDAGGPAATPAQPEPWLGHDEQGVDLTLLRMMLDLAPIDRLRCMERHARDVQALMMHGQRHRATATR